MLCAHLHQVEEGLKAAGVRETFRGKAWTNNSREWAYFDCVLDVARIQKKYQLTPCVMVHENHDPHTGLELGLVCMEHQDAVIGLSPNSGASGFPNKQTSRS